MKHKQGWGYEFESDDFLKNVLMDLSFTVSPLMARIILLLNPFHRNLLVMCRGYSDDDENFTELVWSDDKNLDFLDKESYPEFQLWFRL